METLSPYAGAKIINALLKQYNIIDPKTDEVKVIPPQMIYNYASKGYIKNVNKKIKLEDLYEWAIKYFKKNFNIDLEAIADEEEAEESEVHEGQLALEI